jgi:hypothetical protein
MLKISGWVRWDWAALAVSRTVIIELTQLKLRFTCKLELNLAMIIMERFGLIRHKIFEYSYTLAFARPCG